MSFPPFLAPGGAVAAGVAELLGPEATPVFPPSTLRLAEGGGPEGGTPEG